MSRKISGDKFDIDNLMGLHKNGEKEYEVFQHDKKGEIFVGEKIEKNSEGKYIKNVPIVDHHLQKELNMKEKKIN